MLRLSVRFVCVLICIPLCACAVDRYAMTDGSPISDKSKYNSELFDCKMDALDWYRQAPETEEVRDNDRLAGAFGGLGGAIGGAMAGGISASNNSGRDKANVLIKQKVESCMSQKGYKALPGNSP